MKKIGQRSGAGLSSGHNNQSQSSDAELFGAVRDELDAMSAGLEITSPNASDLATAITLVNEIKTKLNAVVALAKQFEK